ncbi:hypothetical protein PGN35_027145 [Nodosilinea sp. PGN35]|uniref:hypothetical protein n=1 Tax=Nodosilinea sp. PGN35 TaxID=3020489 RepID=UPI0023B2B7CC|nr:hypothetical protein [Nodosilinea sp. TSF1-S3]MDF0365096.1 hypothetical protein [Nodosilinea sp. TSF1-S3]
MLAGLIGSLLWGQLAIAPAPALPRPAFTLLSLPMLGRDAIPYPPLLRQASSPAGVYHLILTLEQDPSGGRHTAASLFETRGDRCQRVWAHTLPHSYGPRLALVNDGGTVVLLDEWINVASPRAIVVMGRTGAVEAEYGFDDIVRVTGQTRAAVVEQAAQGFWLSGQPHLERGGLRVAIPAAGGHLALNLATGELTFDSES